MWVASSKGTDSAPLLSREVVKSSLRFSERVEVQKNLIPSNIGILERGHQRWSSEMNQNYIVRLTRPSRATFT